MLKLLPLLKYVNRDAMSPEALVEILGAFGLSAPVSEVAPVADAFKHRGLSGLMEKLPQLQAWWQTHQAGVAADGGTVKGNQRYALTVVCPECGKMKRVTGVVAELPLV